MTGQKGGDRGPRSGRDRRRSRLPALRFLIQGGRRNAIRRQGDRRAIIVLDRYSPRLFAAILGILCMSLLDALLTLYLIDHGATELNPVMAYLISKGPLVFTIAKYFMTSLAVLIFLLVFNSVSPGSAMAYSSLLSYALIAFGLVIAWELFLVYIANT